MINIKSKITRFGLAIFVLVMCLFPLLQTAPAYADMVVTFPDANLEAAVRATLAKPVGDINQSDLNVFSSFFAVSEGITNLSGMEYWTNLTTTYLADNNISDLSYLSGLTNLTSLSLDENLITNISPLAGLTNLMYLDLGENNISNISALSNLTNMIDLDLFYNNIVNVSPW